MNDPVGGPSSARRLDRIEVLAVGALALVLALVSLWRPVGWFAVFAGVVGLALGMYALRRGSAARSEGPVPGGDERSAQTEQRSPWVLSGVAASGVALVLGLITAVGLVGGSSPEEETAAQTSSPAAPPAGDATPPGAPEATSAATPQSATPQPASEPAQTSADDSPAPAGRAPTVAGSPGAPLLPGADRDWSRPEHPVALGETVQLITKKDRVAVDVTATSLDQSASAVPATLLPTPGHRFVAVSYTVRAQGPATYAQPPSSQLCRVITGDGVAHRPSYFMAANGPALDAAPLVAAGSSATGWVLFEIPTEAEPIAVAYSPTAEWRV